MDDGAVVGFRLTEREVKPRIPEGQHAVAAVGSAEKFLCADARTARSR